MGLLTSVNNLSYTLEEEKKIKQLEQKEKQKIRKRQEDCKRYKKDLESFLYNEFTENLTNNGSSFAYEFYNRETKNEILENFFESIKIYDKKYKFTTIPFKNDLIVHFRNKYNIILKQCVKEQEQQEEYELITEGNKLLQEQEEEKKDSFNSELFDKGLKIGIAILLFPIISILAIINGIMKNSN